MQATALLTATLILLATLQDGAGQFSVIPTNVFVNETELATSGCSHPNSTTIIWRRANGTVISNSTEGFSISPITTPQGSTLNIASADVALHNGSYVCVAVLGGGAEETTAFSIIVQFIGPVSLEKILDPCLNGNIYIQSNIALRCNPSDSFPAVTSISWFRGSPPMKVVESDKINISRDGRYLNLSDVTSHDDLKYCCTVTNGLFFMTSSVEMLGVITSPPPRQLQLEHNGIILPPDGIVLVKEGGITRLNCLITPISPPFSSSDVSWTMNSAGITSSGNVMLFSSSSLCKFTLLIQNTTLSSGEAIFRCHLNDVPTEKSVGVTLRLANIPATYSVMANPNTRILGVNRTITFTCVEDPPEQIHNVVESISWQFLSRSSASGVPQDIVAGGRFVISGRALTIGGLRVSDSGMYVCVADNMLVTAIRTNIALDVEAAPSVTIDPVAPLVKLGLSQVLTCTISSQRPATFKWSINNRPITSNGGFSITFTSSQSTLNIMSLSEQDLGDVTCTACDPLHQPLPNSTAITETGQLYIFGDRTQTTAFIAEGSSLILECPIRARSMSTTTRWFDGGSRELRNGMGGVNVSTLANGSSIVELPRMVSVAGDNGDLYICDVSDGALQFEYRITLYITTPGNISQFPPPMTNVTEGTRVQLDCIVSGRPPPRVTWVTSSSTNLNTSTSTVFENGSLVFDSVQLEDSGNYFCFIGEPIVVTHNTFLRVKPAMGGRSSGGALGLNLEETILVFVMVGVVVVVFILMCPLLIIISCYFCLYRMSSGKYMVNKQDSFDSNSLKQGSLRGGKDNSGVLMVTPTPIFDTLQRSPDPVLPDNRYAVVDSIPLNTFNVGGSASLLTDSHTSSPMRGTFVTTPSHNSVSSPHHGTMASTSLFSSEEHTTLENGLPNFPRNNVKLEELMGQGEFGPVMKAVAKNLILGEPETRVAVKLLVTEAVEDTGFRADLAVVDYANQMKLEYKNIVSILGICSDKEPYYVIYEYLDQGDLKNFLLSSRPEEGAPPKLMDHELLSMIGQVANGMAYLFSQRIIHGDIATRNCLVSSALQVKIGDLGIGHELYTGDYHDNGAQLLPIRWMPPELLTESEEGPSFSLYSDTWSFGVFCWEVMAYARLPYDNYTDEEVLAMIPGGSRLRSPSSTCTPALYLIMMDCWNEEPERRPQFSKMLATLASINLEE